MSAMELMVFPPNYNEQLCVEKISKEICFYSLHVNNVFGFGYITSVMYECEPECVCVCVCVSNLLCKWELMRGPAVTLRCEVGELRAILRVGLHFTPLLPGGD